METVQNYKCPCCSSPLVYSATEGTLHCDSCGNDFSLETLEQIRTEEEKASQHDKYDWEAYTPRTFKDVDTETLAQYTCTSCGGVITGGAELGAAICPYCGNNAIIKEAFEGDLMPDYVIPFKLDRKAAFAAFEREGKKAPFLPKEFKSSKRIKEMTGVYIPFWMFDCQCDANITYDAVKMSTWSDSKYDYVKRDFYNIKREGNLNFTNIPADASKKTEDKYMESIEPFDYSEAVEFKTAYLSGYFADKYDVSAKDCIKRVNERVKNSTEQMFASTINGYVNVSPRITSVNYSNGKIRYALLPVWKLNIKYKDKMYKYIINGQTGKVAGEFPICKKQRNIFFLKAFAASFAVITLLSAILGRMM